ncbi:2Fe-2S iron-sulfur cluster-binding protein [Sneathiella chinensis]|uniref:(2Fe-2S) ferredoxin n=1 Tax=Sneathiella chinensis TaxID=349750 RepID=A0ABQ5U2N2_9PROT|nr:2Fe-2S iron-sulfur cluster-binding protein [Sneathiella chinensis]GLQ05915.1 (2Fe-2S) ferredoxin [Sneathiella chinensis]
MTKNTVKISFKQPSGAIKEIEAPVGQSVMQAAIFNNVDGIEAECGGSCMCATCHIYVPAESANLTGTASEEEQEMLGETAAERRPESRLSCQIVVTADMDGHTFDVPECQS